MPTSCKIQSCPIANIYLYTTRMVYPTETTTNLPMGHYPTLISLTMVTWTAYLMGDERLGPPCPVITAQCTPVCSSHNTQTCLHLPLRVVEWQRTLTGDQKDHTSTSILKQSDLNCSHLSTGLPAAIKCHFLLLRLVRAITRWLYSSHTDASREARTSMLNTLPTLLPARMVAG